MTSIGFEGFIVLLGRFFRQDVPRGQALPKIRWFQWGNIGDDGWYILIMLPSYQMMPRPGWPPHYPPRWHQLGLLFIGTLPAGKEEWHFIHMELPLEGESK